MSRAHSFAALGVFGSLVINSAVSITIGLLLLTGELCRCTPDALLPYLERMLFGVAALLAGLLIPLSIVATMRYR